MTRNRFALHRPTLLTRAPAVMITFAVAYVVLAAWSARQLHLQRKSASEQRRAASDARQNATAEIASKTAVTELEARLLSLSKSLAAEKAATASAASRARDLSRETTIDPSEVTASFGRIDQMAAPFGKLLRLLVTGQKASLLYDFDGEDASKQFFSQILTIGPILSQMEDEPAQIARFHAAILRDAFSLDAEQNAKVTELIQQDFAALKEKGYTASQKPETPDAETAWFVNRDQALGQFAEELKPLLPASDKLALLPGILNLGGGMRFQVTHSQDGHGTITGTISGFGPKPNGS